MLKLIKIDIKKIIQKEKHHILKYIVMFLVLYFGINELSYSGISILISYLIVTNTFHNGHKDELKDNIIDVSNLNEDTVYTKYIVAVITIIIVNIVIIYVMKLSSMLVYRSIVLNDVLFSINVFIVIMSFTLPIFFKYEYYSAKFTCGTISIIIYFIFGSFINMINDRIYEVNFLKIYKEEMLLNDYSGSFSKIMSNIAYGIDTKYLNFYFITTMTIMLFIASMYISLKIIKRHKSIIKENNLTSQ